MEFIACGSLYESRGLLSCTLARMLHRLFLLVSMVVMLLLAVLIQKQPTLLLNVPIVGFIPYMLLFKNNIPYLDFTAWQKDEMRTWIRDGDVVIAAAAKSGTTMLLYISHLIRVKGDVEAYPFREVNIATPWPSLIHKPGQTWEEMKELMNTTVLYDGQPLNQYWNHPNFKFRIFKSHETPVMYEDSNLAKMQMQSNVLDIRSFPTVKFVTMTRDLPDLLASFYPFPANHDDDFVKIWGGFPPAFINVEHFLYTFLYLSEHMGANRLDHAFCGHTLNWWIHRHEPNVLLLHFNEAIHDRKSLIRKLATFYDIELSRDEVDKIYDLSSFEAMKRFGNQFNYQLWGNKKFRNGTGACMKSGKLLRKGAIGDSKVTFTDQQLQKLRAFEDKFYGLSEEGIAAKQFSRYGHWV